MILTNKFVVLNFPRTGSTFLRSGLRRAHAPWWDAWGFFNAAPRSSSGFQELKLPIDRTFKAERLGRHSQHGRWEQIPPSHRHLPVVSIIRHPLDRTVSSYLHTDWWQAPPADIDTLSHRFPTWPHLSFTEYLSFEDEFCLPDVLKGIQPKVEMGCHTAHFLRFFSRDPDSLLAGLTDERIQSGAVAADLPPIHWLRHDHLTDDLATFLSAMGYPKRAIELARNHPRLNVSEARRNQSWREYFTPETEARTRPLERLIFQMFPELDT
jgi:hypothetical protein